MKHFLLLTFMTMLIGVTACKNQKAEAIKVDLNDLVLLNSGGVFFRRKRANPFGCATATFCWAAGCLA